MVNYAALPTEGANPRSRRLDLLSTPQLLSLMNREDFVAARSVGRARASMARAVDLIVRAFDGGGRLFLAGAGTSGRLCVLEAAECPPTFNTKPGLVRAVMAGGKRAVFRSQEGAEDRAADARRVAARDVRKGDVMIGVAASGVTPFTRAAIDGAKRKGAATVLLTCNKREKNFRADAVIVLDTGPEVLTGSTRLKAGTATKLALNALTTAAMARVGKVYDHWMVDLQPRSYKLVQRGLRLISALGHVSPKDAERLFGDAGRHVKTAVVMARRKTDAATARRLLRQNKNSLRKVIG